MSTYPGPVTIGGLFNVAAANPALIIPVFFNGVTYKITAASLLSIVTKDSVGLGSVDNTSDLNKPLSTAAVDALLLKANVTHGHEIADVNGLVSALLAKASVAHDHGIPEVIGLQQVLDGKAPLEHMHSMTSIVDLDLALASKANSADVQAALSAKADMGHVHSTGDVTGLVATLQSFALQSSVDTSIAQLNESFTETVNVLSNNVQVNDADIRNQASSDKTMLINLLGTKAAVTHAHSIDDVSGLNGRLNALALQSNVDGSIAQLQTQFTTVTDELQATKAPTAHTHTYAEIGELETDINDLFDYLEGKASLTHTHQISNVQNLQETLDMKVDVDHTHKVSDVSNFDTAVKDVVASYLLPGSNVQIDNGPGGLTISSTGSGGAPVVSNSLKVFRLLSQAQFYENSMSQSTILEDQHVIGEDLVTYSSYGSLYQFDKDGYYRIRVTVTAQRVNQGVAPAVVPPANNQITYGSKISNYQGVAVLSHDTAISKTTVGLTVDTSDVVSWSNEFLINALNAGAQATISTFLYGKDGDPLDPADWEMSHYTSVVVERYSGTTDNFVRSPGSINVLRLISDNQSIVPGSNTQSWTIDAHNGQDTQVIGYDGGFDEFIINTTGTYRVTMQSMVGRSWDYAETITATPAPFINSSYGTLTASGYGVEILGDSRLPITGAVTLTQDSEFAAWIHEFYISVSDPDARLSIKDWFNATVDMPLEWTLIFSATLTFERLGDSLAVPV